MTNGGPIVADINSDGYDDIIVASSAGEVKASLGPSGTLAWSYDLWTARQDWPFGHVAIGDIDNDKKLEIVIGGAQRGGIYVLNAESGTEQFVKANLYSTYQNYFYGSGPILMDVDGTKTTLEIVASMAGYPGPAAVLALSNTGNVLWRTTVPNDKLMYTSPAAADTDGDGKLEVFVQGYAGTLFKFRAADGVLQTSKALGSNSWSSPGFLDVNYDGKMEVVSSTLSSTIIMDTSLNTIDHYDNSNAGLFPPPIIGDTDKNGTLDLVTGAWYPQQLVSISLPYTSAYSWSAFEGSAKHAGSVPAASPDTVLGSNVAPATVVVLNALVDAVDSTSNRNQKNNLTKARDYVDTAYRQYLLGNPHTAVHYLSLAVSSVESARSRGYPAASATALEQQLAYDCVLMFQQYIDRTAAIVGPTKSQVVAAKNTLASAQSEYNAADYDDAADKADDGADDLRDFLDSGGQGAYTVGSYCPTALGEVYLAWECRLVAVRNQVKTWLMSYPTNSALKDADEDLRLCIVWGPDLVFDTAYPSCADADADLARFTQQSTAAARNSLAFAVMRNTRLYIDDATTWFRTVDPSALSTAETQYANGVSQYNAGNYSQAHTSFTAAYTTTRPCSGSSFGSPVQGLSGGGCRP
jgi:hypothetical protein